MNPLSNQTQLSTYHDHGNSQIPNRSKRCRHINAAVAAIIQQQASGAPNGLGQRRGYVVLQRDRTNGSHVLNCKTCAIKVRVCQPKEINTAILSAKTAIHELEESLNTIVNQTEKGLSKEQISAAMETLSKALQHPDLNFAIMVREILTSLRKNPSKEIFDFVNDFHEKLLDDPHLKSKIDSLETKARNDEISEEEQECLDFLKELLHPCPLTKVIHKELVDRKEIDKSQEQLMISAMGTNPAMVLSCIQQHISIQISKFESLQWNEIHTLVSLIAQDHEQRRFPEVYNHLDECLLAWINSVLDKPDTSEHTFIKIGFVYYYLKNVSQEQETKDAIGLMKLRINNKMEAEDSMGNMQKAYMHFGRLHLKWKNSSLVTS